MSATHGEAVRTDGAQSGEAPSGPPQIGNTIFAFHHKVFEVPGAVFRMDRTTHIVSLHLHMGANMASLELRQIEKTFGIEPDSPDGELLKLIEKSLRYVREIRPGDSIPNEVLDGSASWSIEPKHYERARSKLIVQLVNWMTAGNSTIEGNVDVMELINRPEVKERISDAFGAAARHLGVKDIDKETVISMIGQLANEVAYVEALRDKVAGYMVIKKKLRDFTSVYRGDRRVLDVIDRISMLIASPFTKLREQFQLVDAQTAEILSSLRQLAATVSFLRGVRDELREFALVWEDLDQRWIEIRMERGAESEALITRTYRFAAMHYASAQRWSLNVS